MKKFRINLKNTKASVCIFTFYKHSEELIHYIKHIEFHLLFPMQIPRRKPLGPLETLTSDSVGSNSSFCPVMPDLSGMESMIWL